MRLLLISDDEKQHYCMIKSMSRLLSSQTTKHNGKRWFCDYCLNGFAKEDSLNNHLEYCGNNEAVRTIFPREAFTNFRNYFKYMRVPFAMYANFEGFTEKLSNARCSEVSQYMLIYQKHEPSGFCFLIVSPYFEFEPVIYTKKSKDENIGWIFFEAQESEIQKVCDMIKYQNEMIFTQKDKRIDKESLVERASLLRKIGKLGIIAIFLENSEVPLTTHAI